MYHLKGDVIKAVHLPANFTVIVPVQVKHEKSPVMLEPSIQVH